jgi:HopA1 effector protein family
VSAALYDAQLREIAEAVTLTAADSAQVATLGGTVQTVAVANARGPFLGLAEMLYATRYNVPRASAPPAPAGLAVDDDPEAFLRALRGANALRQRYDRGMPVARESITSQYGHYVLFGQPMHEAGTGRQVRFYWNLAVEGATAFVHEIATRFERARIPFQAKLPVHPAGYVRTDTGVLYLGDDDVEAATDPIRATHAALRPFLGAEAPFFTLPLAPGLAFAESPPNGDSFGLHRCDLIAEGLVRAFEQGAADADARLAAVRERLTKYGLDLERLAFNPASRYPYRLGALAEAA